jgi:drug/metabolite transporter (DMT)-like permease
LIDRRRALGVAAGFATAVLWGSWATLSKLGVVGGTLDAWDVAFLRYAAGSMVMLPVILGAGGATRDGLAGTPWRGVMIMAMCGGAPYFLVALHGFDYAPAARQAVFGSALVVVFTMLASWFWLGEERSLRQVLGVAVVFIGIAFVAARGFEGGLASLGRGDLLFALSSLLWTGFTVAARRWRVSAVHATAILSVMGFVMLAPIYLALFGLRLLAASPFEIMWNAIYQGIVTGIIATLFYGKTIENLGAAGAALFVALVPPLATLLAWPVLDEVPSVAQLVGVLLVSVGIAATIGWPSRITR